MRVLLISDVHGNLAALEAVLAELYASPIESEVAEALASILQTGRAAAAVERNAARR